jgi:AraC-like DNA-binding protein
MLNSLSNTSDIPLSEHTILRTSDMDVLENFLNREEVLEKRTLTQLDNCKKINARITSAVLQKIHFMGVHLGANIRAKSMPLKVTQILVPVNGRVIDNTTGTPEIISTGESALVHMPNQPVEVNWEENSAALVIRIPEDYLQRVYQDLTDKEMSKSFTLSPIFDLTSPSGNNLLVHILNIMNTIRSQTMDNTNIRVKELWEELLVTTLLSDQKSIVDHFLYTKDNQPIYRYVKRAVDYIAEHGQSSFTINELARVSGCSVRTLQLGFNKCYAVSPMTFIRNHKLENTYKELLDCSPIDNKVCDIAAKWGFPHASKFTKQYKKYFGELPSETLYKRKTLISVSPH